MRIDVDRMNAEEASNLAEQLAVRAAAVTEATEALEIKQRALIAALLERTQASRDVGRYRAEIAELERIIKPRRHRKAAAQPDAAPDVAPAVKPRRSRKAGAK